MVTAERFVSATLSHLAGGRVLIFSESPASSASARLTLCQAGMDADVVTELKRVESLVRQGGVDLVVGDKLSAPLPVLQMLERVQERPKLLLITNSTNSTAALRALVEQGFVNFLGSDQNGEVDPVDLIATAQRIVLDQPMDVSALLTAGTAVTKYSLRKSTEKSGCLEFAYTLAADWKCSSFVGEALVNVLDELVTNAMYDAPVDSLGRSRFAHLTRDQPVALEAHENVQIRVGCDSSKVVLGVKDCFGTLRPAEVASVLARCLEDPVYRAREGKGGAGLGLYQVFRHSHHLIFSISPGFHTEVFAVMYRTGSHRRFEQRSKSLNLFVETRAK